MKRVFDFVLALVLLLIFSPVMLAVAFLVYIKMGAPILFKQERPGLYGKPFFIYKFRTMNDKKDEKGQLLPDEQRLTTLGQVMRKLSLDELPQLINVAKGEMSFVGPRPLLMEYLPLYNKEQARRHEVKPGITGWAQVNGRNDISWEDKFALDVWYVDNRSFFLDIKIIGLTILKVFRTEGVSKSGHATTTKFEGTAGKSRGENHE